MQGLRRALVAVAAGLVLADASIVALALPSILAEMHTTITGVAAVVGVYALVLAVAMLPAARLHSDRAGVAGLGLFALASFGCGIAGTLGVLLFFRALQAAGGALALLAAFHILDAAESRSGRRLWIGAALVGTAAGPALGGALTEVFDWRAIFFVQVPIAAVAALACWRSLPATEEEAPMWDPGMEPVEPATESGLWSRGEAAPPPVSPPAGPPTPGRHEWLADSAARREEAERAAASGRDAGFAGAAPGRDAGLAGAAPGRDVGLAGAAPAAGLAGAAPGRDAGRDRARVTATDFDSPPTRPVAAAVEPAPLIPLTSLAFTAAAFTAILFLLVIELVAGFALSPLRAALGVTVLPIAALAAAAIPGEARARALAGAVLLAGGAVALGFLPAAGIAWTIVPQLLAGAGMGLALPAYSGELLPERNVTEAARALVARHVGVVVVLAILAPVATNKLQDTTERAVLQGAALVLDAQIDPLQKLALAPALFEDVDVERPREGLQAAVARQRGNFADNAAVYDRLAVRLDDVVVVAVQDAFKTAYLIAAGLALLAAALLFTAWRRPAVWLATIAAVSVVVVYIVEHGREAPAPVALADPCVDRALPEAGGFAGAIQNEALKLLDRAACDAGTSREEYALALFDPERAKTFEREHGINPRSAGGLLSLLGG